MNLTERLSLLVSALPSDDAAVTLTRADLAVLLEGYSDGPKETVGDLTVQDVAARTHRAACTVRTWLISGKLRGYKLNRRDWRVPESALREFLDAQSEDTGDERDDSDPVDISAWRSA